jgi:hypothetical protein
LDSSLGIFHGIKARRSEVNVSDETAADGIKEKSDMIIQMAPGNGSTSRRSCHRILEANPYLEKDNDEIWKVW